MTEGCIENIDAVSVIGDSTYEQNLISTSYKTRNISVDAPKLKRLIWTRHAQLPGFLQEKGEA